MIYKFQPFSVTRELGKEYNAHCELVPNEDDWILILDYDAMILDPIAYKLIEEAIQLYPQYEILTAVTNRVGYAHQRLNPRGLDRNDSIIAHLAIAQEQSAAYGSKVVPINTAAGFFLLFRKKYWLENKFQPKILSPTGRLFDWNFCDKAYRRGSVGMMKGVYVWHTYRLLQKDYREINHLKDGQEPGTRIVKRS